MAAAASPAVVEEARQQTGDLEAPKVEQCTLLELVGAVNEVTDNDNEVVATVTHMLRTGSVRLTGNFHGQPISNFDDDANS
jgi:hypothetical protein